MRSAEAVTHISFSARKGFPPETLTPGNYAGAIAHISLFLREAKLAPRPSPSKLLPVASSAAGWHSDPTTAAPNLLRVFEFFKDSVKTPGVHLHSPPNWDTICR